MSRCPVTVRWGTTLESTTQCDKDEDHWGGDNRDLHEGPGLPEFSYQRVSWIPGDRREYVGAWPGNCTTTIGCILPTGHHGRCAT